MIPILALALIACEPKEAETDDSKSKTDPVKEAPEFKTDKGVDADKKVIKIGTLNDESGAAKGIGIPFAVGKRVLAAQINEGKSGLLPEGWKVELVERDHEYVSSKSVGAYNEIKDDVLFIGTSFGTPNTLPLLKSLEADNIVAMPASLSSKMAEHPHTPPIGPAYYFEAMRAMDWAVEDAGGADKVKAGIVYQQDDYGQDGVHGWETAAEGHGVKIVASQTVKPGDKDFAAVVKALQDAGANYVLITALPTEAATFMGTAMQMKYQPKFIGNTPTWVDGFFAGKAVPTPVFANFHLVSGVPFWGEESAGMKSFLAAYEKHGKKDAPNPDSYILLSYIQGLAAVEVAKRAIEAKDVTREGYKKQLASIKGWNANGLIQPIDWSKAPYIVSTKTRILKPDFEKKTWTVAGDFAEPKNYKPPVQ